MPATRIALRGGPLAQRLRHRCRHGHGHGIARLLTLGFVALLQVPALAQPRPAGSGALQGAPATSRGVELAAPAPAAGMPGPLVAAMKPGDAARLVPRSESQVELLQALYRANGGRPLWLGDGKPGATAATVHARLSAASIHGLRAEDYRAAWLGESLAALRDAMPPPAAEEVARADVVLTLALLRYLADVRHGRSSVRQISGAWKPTPGFLEPMALLDASLDPAVLQRMLDAASPAYPMYARLLKARASYEALIAADREAPVVASAGKIEPGDASTFLPVIASRLLELGDLPASATLPQRHEGELVEAVKRFQLRHGLAADGVIGKGTLAALQAPNRQRLRQIDLALERLRWLPPLSADRVIGVNIPDFRLWAYARHPPGGRMELVLESNVVVGRQGRTPTPVFIADMTQVDFVPYWNVPISIARGEILPRLRRDPGYLDRQQMEFVADNGRTVSRQVSSANMAAVAAGTMRIRQRPGGENALGKVKFSMPNTMNIYLHDTPSRSLFAQSRRDFSHGCIRVEQAGLLAQYVLAGDPAWDEASIRRAMAGDRLQVVRLQEPVPVVVFYTTAMVEDDGTLRFLPDIYGYDSKLDAFMPVAD
jgi:murein L,D-transpeptidase YcbB/YkuD